MNNQITFHNPVTRLVGTKRTIINGLGLTILAPLFFGMRIANRDTADDIHWNNHAYSRYLEQSGHLPTSTVTLAMLLAMAIYCSVGLLLDNLTPMGGMLGAFIGVSLMVLGIAMGVVKYNIHYCHATLPKNNHLSS